ncbi:chorismate synthase [bacterium]|nr:chorismate synthase [bacterium]MBD3239362.1 chorismate synthase [Chitinivibrionales bacterium]
MAPNSIGTLFRVTTFGESHGPAIGVVVDGVPPYLELGEEDIQKELDRRRPGQSSVSTPRKESDTVEIVSGVFKGRTMGTPVAMIIRNRNHDSSAYDAIKHKYRPGHADFGYTAKYGVRDWRGSGRASGRETATRVAAGAVARKLLSSQNITVVGFARAIAGIHAQSVDYSVIEQNIVRTADAAAADAMIQKIEEAQASGDSVGGIIETHVKGCPAGLGDPVFDKLQATLAHAVLSVGAVKGVEFGAGFGCSGMRGSEYNDEFTVEQGRVRTKTNACGGILGGISTGEDIVIRAAVRAPASIALKQNTVTVDNTPDTIQTFGRHDPCVVPRAIPVVEAMVAIVLADALLQHNAYERFRCSQQQLRDFIESDQ